MDDFTQAVDDGLRLAKRVCYSKDRYVPPKAPAEMERTSGSLLPTAPTMYAVIYDPAVVDNPDLPSYQPHVHGRMDPPALIPLQMKGVALDVDCHLDTVVVSLTASWRVHCVMGSRRCDCLLVVPMGEQGSLLGVEAEVCKKTYYTQVVNGEEDEVFETPRCELGGCLKGSNFSLSIPEVVGGSVVSVKASWVQKVLYKDGEFCIRIPFSFPEFVNPVGKVKAGREKISLSVNSGTEKEVMCQTTSHALKEMKRQLGALAFSYEADVLTWSTADFQMSYTVYSSSLFGGLIQQRPSIDDFDQREMFCFYLYPGIKQEKVFKKEVVFIVDKSESMRERTVESIVEALSISISKLSPEDSFNIIAFNNELSIFSPSLESATDENIKGATQWMHTNFIAEGGTNIMQPLDKALHMLSNTTGIVPYIFLITDGSVEDERSICSTMRTNLKSKGHIAPRISTFGLGLYCNHYFLRTLATISRGQYDAAFDVDSVGTRMQSLIERVLSPILVDININIFDDCDDAFEVLPFPIPDLSEGRPLILSGRYEGCLPDSIKATGTLADMTNATIDIKVQKINDIPLDRVFIRQEMDLLTAQAWFSDNKRLRNKVTDLSKQGNLSSEYCHMVLHQREDLTISSKQKENNTKLLPKRLSSKPSKLVLVAGMTIGFGNISATSQNLPTGFVDLKKTPAASSAVFKNAMGCCGRIADCCCCMCCIRLCSRLNDQCMILMAQVAAALAFIGCLECCSVCCDND